MHFKALILFTLICCSLAAFCQQDMDLHITGTYLQGKNILKVKRDFHDPYLWVLAQNNEVYRINSQTRVVESLTSQFAAYNNLQFIDIAGRSQDTVFIATNSTNIVEYKKGVTKVIGAGDGIAGTVNSIGLSALPPTTYAMPNQYIVTIGTSGGLCRYDCKDEVMLPILSDNGNVINGKTAHIYEATYRALMFDGPSSVCLCYPDTVQHKGISSFVSSTQFDGELYFGGNSFGHTLKSAYFTTGDPYVPNEELSLYANQFWATENGLFENKWDYSFSTIFFPSRHYLKGIDISKITSIYGLIPFGSYVNTGLVHENLLIGSSQGLYFSNSQYRNGLNLYTFFHFNDLGNKAINDICVDANSYDIVSTNYYNHPSPYGNTVNSTQDSYVCEDGIWIAANDGLYFITPDYLPYIDMTQKINGLKFDAYNLYQSTEIQVCANTPTQMDIYTNYYGGNSIQWYRDGIALVNETKFNLTTSEPGDYYAILYDPCTPIHLETNHLKISTVAAPVFTFNYADKLYYCSGSNATLQTENNPNYQYRWYKDGTLNGIKTASLNVTDAGKYKLEVSGCSGNWVSTKEVEVNFIKLPQPSVSADKSAYCIGDQSTLTVNTPLSDTYDINWYLNGTPINADQNKTSIVTDQPGSYTVNVSSKLASCIQSSASYNLSFEPPPTLSLQKIINTTFCDGQSVSLKATYSGGTIKWSTGETVDQINTKQTGIYTAMVSTAAGCTVSKDISVQFFPNPVLNIQDASLCQFTNQTITLTAPAGFAKYEWNGQAGTSTYVTGTLGKVTLKVTDNNGCTASQTINISSHCDDIHIPNTFTPNGDGINDKWEIAGLQGDESTIVKVYNRYGELLFKNVGYSIPWDGTYKDKKLPAGVYYYVINTRGSNQVISGSVSIIY